MSRRRSLGDAVLAEVARVFAVLGDPTRLRIIEHLREGPLCVSELVLRLGAKQANVSKQLGVLHAAGLLGRERDGIQVRYFVSDPLVSELCDAVCSKLARDAKETVSALHAGGVRRAPRRAVGRP